MPDCRLLTPCSASLSLSVSVRAVANSSGLMGLLDDEFLTVAEVAELLKLNQQTVRNWI